MAGMAGTPGTTPYFNAEQEAIIRQHVDNSVERLRQEMLAEMRVGLDASGEHVKKHLQTKFDDAEAAMKATRDAMDKLDQQQKDASEHTARTEAFLAGERDKVDGDRLYSVRLFRVEHPAVPTTLRYTDLYCQCL